MILPTIDLGGPPVGVARAVGEASRTTGVFFATNHGVPASVIDDHFALARAFFALDPVEKGAIDVSRSNCFRGYEALGSQTIDAMAPGDWKEGFIMGPDLPPDHPHVLARYPNTGANLWPRRPETFRRQMEAYVGAMNGLGRRVAAVLARSLDLPDAYFARALTDPLTYSQLFHYPSLPATDADVLFGAGEHVDWGMLTILLQDSVGGLEIRGTDGVWYAAPPPPGTFTIFLGELMVRLTGGAYRSPLHRVAKNTSGRSRYSMPTFFDPPYDYRIACVRSCVPAHGKPRFPARTVAEHMREMARATLGQSV